MLFPYVKWLSIAVSWWSDKFSQVRSDFVPLRWISLIMVRFGYITLWFGQIVGSLHIVKEWAASSSSISSQVMKENVSSFPTHTVFLWGNATVCIDDYSSTDGWMDYSCMTYSQFYTHRRCKYKHCRYDTQISRKCVRREIKWRFLGMCVFFYEFFLFSRLRMSYKYFFLWKVFTHPWSSVGICM